MIFTYYKNEKMKRKNKSLKRMSAVIVLETCNKTNPSPIFDASVTVIYLRLKNIKKKLLVRLLNGRKIDLMFN